MLLGFPNIACELNNKHLQEFGILEQLSFWEQFAVFPFLVILCFRLYSILMLVGKKENAREQSVLLTVERNVLARPQLLPDRAARATSRQCSRAADVCSRLHQPHFTYFLKRTVNTIATTWNLLNDLCKIP